LKKIRTLCFLVGGLLLNLSQVISAKAAVRPQNNISYESYQLLYDKNDAAVRNDDAFGLSLAWSYEKRNWQANFAGQARFYQQSNDFGISVPEAYLRWNHPTRHIKATFGRQILNWNPTEEFWLQSQVNTRQGQSLMSESQEGLTGINVAWHNDYFATEIFGSVTYIPRLTSAWRERDGHLYNTAYWEVAPPESTTIVGKEVPISYHLRQPRVRDILWRPAVGIHLGPQWGSPTRQSSLKAYAMIKPENTLRASADGHLDTGNAQDVPPQFMAEVGVVVHYQNIYGIDWHQKFDQWDFNLGLRATDPHQDPARKRLANLVNVSQKENAYLQFDTRQKRHSYLDALLAYGGEYWNWAVSYIRYLRGHKDNQEMLTSPTEWENAVGGKISYAFSDTWQTTAKTQYDLARHDLLLRGELNINFLKSVAVTMGMELLKAGKNGYWYRYRQKSTVYSSLAYTF